MIPNKHFIMILCIVIIKSSLPEFCVAQSVVSLPQGVKKVWDLDRAYRETSPTRESVCINGLWRWQPTKKKMTQVPIGAWGYFKVPGPWPKDANGDFQRMYPHPSWEIQDLSIVNQAWYQREITIPGLWEGRRITVYAEYVYSQAAVFVDGKEMGIIHFGWGEVDLTSALNPGRTHVLSIFLSAMPLNETLQSFTDTGKAYQVKGSVAQRGLCGDVYLISTPQNERISDVKMDTSVREWKIAFDTAMDAIDEYKAYTLSAKIKDQDKVVKNLRSKPFKKGELNNGRFKYIDSWKPEKLWDIHTPQNMYTVELSLLGRDGNILDTFQPIRFGFREFWVDGRNFRFNGSRFHSLIGPIENAQSTLYRASYKGACESMQRLKDLGINMGFTHYYNCQPGVHLGLQEIFRAADDVGFLLALSQPHFNNFNWRIKDKNHGEANGYRRHAEFYVRMAQNHPSVVMYSTSHNATSQPEGMNPDNIGVARGKGTAWSEKNAMLALKAEAIIRDLDPSRPVYHHSSSNLSMAYTDNFYLNFVPVQERSDWFETWSRNGVLPVILVEYGPPLPFSWMMYRGWYKNRRGFTNELVMYEHCSSEWGSQFRGDIAFKLTKKERENIKFEAKAWKHGKPWKRWAYPNRTNSYEWDVPNRLEVQAMYKKDNLRTFRTLGVSLPGAWSHERYWRRSPEYNLQNRELDVDWDTIQRPGYSIDSIPKWISRIELSEKKEDWLHTAASRAFVDNSQPLLAYIAGKPDTPTAKGHNFLPGDMVQKQIIVINDSRETVDCECSWALRLLQPISGQERVIVKTGEQVRIPLKITLPSGTKAGIYKLDLHVKFDKGDAQQDTFSINVLPNTNSVEAHAKILLFDPKGYTRDALKGLGILFQEVDASTRPSGDSVLVVGKKSLSVDGLAPDITALRDGLRVVMFEQELDVLEKRFGFRTVEYGLRRVFPRVPDHPVLAELDSHHLHDWHGEATTMASRLKYKYWPRHGPSVVRCGVRLTRPWRCGCRGNVASVLIEKPARGNFLPIVDGGFSLQYSPLMEFREGKGMMILCQMDLTGRTESDPGAELLMKNVVSYATAFQPYPRRKAIYVGEQAGRKHFEQAGVSVNTFNNELSPDQVLIVGPGGGDTLVKHRATISTWLSRGGHLFVFGLEGRQASGFLPFSVQTNKTEHIDTFFQTVGMKSLLAGIGPADLLSRMPMKPALITGGAKPVGNGVLAIAEKANVAFCQLTPWQYDYKKMFNLKRTYRRLSCVVSRVLGNMGVVSSTPLIARFSKGNGGDKAPWLNSYYLDEPEEMDDPYRYFRW